MRYPPGHRERTRHTIAETASRMLRREGIANTTIVPLMRRLGLTQGAFYRSFSGRDQLISAGIAHGVAQTRDLVEDWIASAQRDHVQPIARIIDEYLSERHLDSHEYGCVIAAIGSELWRQSGEVRQKAVAACDPILMIVADQMAPDRRIFVRPLYMLMAGVLSSARVAGGREEQLLQLATGRAAAYDLACPRR